VKVPNKLKRYKDKLALFRVGRYWGSSNKLREQQNPANSRWWQFKQIVNHIDESVYNGPESSGFIQAAINEYNLLPCDYAVSVGCGNASKELQLLSTGLVERFDLYEVSADRICEAKERAESMGLSDRVTFFQENVFDCPAKENTYDLVYWDNSLHHMFDVEKALEWSYQVLKPLGGFLMNDFIGPSRFQWSDTQLDYARRVRECFSGTKYLKDPKNSLRNLPTKVDRPSKLGMIYEDPSEAADSSRIISALQNYFPSVSILKTGGVVYHLALNDMLANFDELEDSHLINLLMLVDDLLVQEGEAHYAVAFARKE
jgi:ubiquinone/menaquinone biosynthesis C-methylase UbiE